MFNVIASRYTEKFPRLLIWLFPALLAIALAWTFYPSTVINGERVPVFHDSFYHARRILDAISGSTGFYEFDRLMHAPEGSWVTWPWAYHYLAAAFVSGVVKTGLASDVKQIIFSIPVAFAFLNTVLLYRIFRTLRLSDFVTFLLLLFYACLPATRALHGVGVLDHHFLEHSFILLTLLTGLSWVQNPGEYKYAIFVGITLGVAPAFHNGLFLLQLPLLVYFLVRWLRRQTAPPETIAAYCGASILATLIVLLPSEPFQKGFFNFYYLSWFHLFLASITAACLLTMRYIASRFLGSSIIFALAVVFSVVVVFTQGEGFRFLTASLEQVSDIQEARSLPKFVLDNGLLVSLSYYSGLLLLVLPTLIWAIWILWYGADEIELFLASFALVALLMMCTHFRFHYYGLALLLMISGYWMMKYFRPGLRIAGATALLVLGIAPSVGALMHAPSIAGHADFEYLYPAYKNLQSACKQRGGNVLADMNDGHYIRYFTECSNISNNFIMTRQHEEKIRLTNAMMTRPLEQVMERWPWVDYIFVRLTRNEIKTGRLPLLKKQLLQGSPPWARAQLLYTSRFNVSIVNKPTPIARIIRVVRNQ